MYIKKQKNTRRKITLMLAVAVLAVVGWLGTAYHRNFWPFNTTSMLTNSTEQEPSDNNTSTINPAAEDRVKNGGNSGQEKSPTAGSGVSDTDGKDVTKQAGGVKSTSGKITLYSPTQGQRLTGAINVQGAASVSEVYYRINDDVNGMIGSGRLSVKNGLFSGNLSANTNASKGSFEVYSFNSQGQEINNIIVEITY